MLRAACLIDDTAYKAYGSPFAHNVGFTLAFAQPNGCFQPKSAFL